MLKAALRRIAGAIDRIHHPVPKRPPRQTAPARGPRLQRATLVAAAAVGAGLMLPAAASAATYEVSLVGRDSGNGSPSSPWRTIKKGMESLRPGDTLLLRGGVYTEEVTGMSLSKGTPSAPITVRAYPGERPILRGLLAMYSSDYWILDGLNVTWAPGSERSSHGEHMVKMIDGANWRITNSEIWGAQAYSALLIGGTSRNWRVDHNFIHDTVPTHDGSQDHLIYISTPVGGGVVDRNLLANSPNGRGVKVGPSSPGSTRMGGVTIRFNTFLNNTGPSNVQLSYGASDNLIYRNIMAQTDRAYANVTAFNLQGSGNKAHDNIGWSSARVMDSDQGLSDGGGNLHLDPQLLGDMRPAHPVAQGYGRFAPGDDPDRYPPPPPPPPAAAAPPPAAAPGAARRGCVKRRRLVIRVRPRKGKAFKGKVVKAKVWVQGKRVRVRRDGRRWTAVIRTRKLRKPRSGRVRVKTVVRTRSGKRITTVRRYRLCVPAKRH